MGGSIRSGLAVPAAAAPASSTAQREEDEVDDGEGEQDSVGALHDATVARNAPAQVLPAEVTLDQRLRQVAERACHSRGHTDEKAAGEVEAREASRHEGADESRCDDRPEEPLPRLARADRRR